MTLTIEPTGATLGAVVTGVDLAGLDDATWARVEAAFEEHAVLVFPGQHLSPEAQAAFGRRFGELDTLVKDAGVSMVSNLRSDGSLRGVDEPRMLVLKGNEGWHTDSSYMPLAAKASMLSARVVPPSGGETEWADMRAAYDALDDATKERIAGLAAYHSIAWSQAQIGDHTERGSDVYGFQEEVPLRPLVKVHPATGRPALYLGRHAHAIPGLDPEESRRLLDDLVDFACRPPRVLRHEWTEGDLVVWDNRCVLHRARPYDYGQPRVMVHTRVAGDPATELASEFSTAG